MYSTYAVYLQYLLCLEDYLSSVESDLELTYLSISLLKLFAGSARFLAFLHRQLSVILQNLQRASDHIGEMRRQLHAAVIYFSARIFRAVEPPLC